MCGIAGFCINKKDHLPRLSEVVDELLLEIEARGKDSTGMAYVRQGRAFARKDAIPASAFVKGKITRPIDGASLGILHTRYATQGTPKNRANNHPILHGSIVGVHNGHINNDDEIFRELGVPRVGQVDSEAAFALIDNEPDTLSALSQIRGGAALAWFNRDEYGSTLHLARVSSSPLAVGMTARGSFFFASTMPMLESALFVAGIELDWKMNLSEGSYLKVRNGRVESFDSFTPAKPALRAVSGGWTPKPKRESRYVDIDMTDEPLPSRWFGWDGEWIDDDTFVPYVND
jgi:glucosamine 6-phosphate synthetase-like amidotransferase/phosphosugar isomerase protein